MNRIVKGFLLTGGLACLSSACSLLAPGTHNTTEYQAIHQAALSGDSNEIRTLLLGNPGLVNVRDYDQNSPLHLAAINGHADAVTLLIAKGAKVNAVNSA